jgi:hypothetical protein
MISIDEAKIIATVEIAKIMGFEYTKQHIGSATESFPIDEPDKKDFEYFLAFEGDEETGNWTVFGRVSVDRETQKVTFLDYKLPDGTRMENPISPVRWA